MKNTTLLIGGVLILGLSVRALAIDDNALSARFDPAKHWRSSELKRGMRGYGLTVFQGTTIERFQVELLGILQNEWTETDMILARVSGGPLRQTGVIAGMSGSPIYIDDRMVGALAYAWSFSKDSIAGITPIENMLPVIDLPPTERGDDSWGGEANIETGRTGQTNSTPLDWFSRVRQYLVKDHSGVLSEPPYNAVPVTGMQELPVSNLGQNLIEGPLGSVFSPLEVDFQPAWVPLATPITAGGVSSQVLQQAAGLLSPMGLVPVPGGMPSAYRDEKVELEPGSAIGVQLVRGDLDMAGIGTVTYRDEDRILAFGHPMFQDGATDLPMTTAFINLVLPSVSLSTKMGGAIEAVGALEQDRLPAIGGTLGEKSPTLPVSIHINNRTAGTARDFSYEIAYHRFYTPRFAMFCVLDAIDVTARGFRDSTLSYTLTVHLKDREEIVLQDQLSSSSGTSFSLAMTLGDVVDILLRNPYEKVELESVSLDIDIQDRLRIGTLDYIEVDNQEVEQGHSLGLSLAVQNWLGEKEVVRKEIELPEDFPTGFMQVTIADAKNHLMESVKRNPDAFRPRDLDSLLELLETYYRNDEIFVTLAALTPGASFFGSEMPGLPTSVLRVMADSGDLGTGGLVATQVLSVSSLQLDRPVSGAQRLIVNVQPSKRKRIN